MEADGIIGRYAIGGAVAAYTLAPLLTRETGTLALYLSFLGPLTGFAADCFPGDRRS
jgi:hypothetical protein